MSKKELVEKVDLEHVKIESTDLTDIKKQEKIPYHEEEDKIIIEIGKDVESVKELSSEEKSAAHVPYAEEEDTTILNIDRTDNIIKKSKKEEVPVPWIRGKKTKGRREIEEIKPSQVTKLETKSEEDKPTEISEAPWRRKPKSSIQKKISEIEPDKVKSDITEVSEATWRKPEKSKMIKAVKEEPQVEDFTSVVLKPAKWHEKSEEQIPTEEIVLKPAKQLSKEKEIPESIILKPVKKETPKPEAPTEKIDEISNGEVHIEKLDLPWRRGKKLTRTEEKLEDIQLKPSKEINKPEEVILKPDKKSFLQKKNQRKKLL